MKKTSSFLTFLFLAGIVFTSFAQNDRTNNNSTKTKKNRLLKTVSTSIPSIDFEYDYVRRISELDVDTYPESNPWISNDGLRLYYETYQTGDTSTHIAFAERQHIDSTFGDPKFLSLKPNSTFDLTPWLTEDELSIFFTITTSVISMNTTIYRSNRNSISENFGESIPITLSGKAMERIGNPCFTQDLSELYLYNLDTNTAQILIFNKIGVNSYQLSDTLNVPEGFSIRSGKLADNDLKYYISLTDSNRNEFFYVYIRKEATLDFDSIYYLDNDLINDPYYANRSPSISSDGKCFVFIRNDKTSWTTNELFITYNPGPVTGGFNESLNNSVSIYPNPASDFVTFDLNNLKNVAQTLTIHTQNGVLVETRKFSSNSSITIPTSHYTSGIYYYNIINTSSPSAAGMFIVNNQ